MDNYLSQEGFLEKIHNIDLNLLREQKEFLFALEIDSSKGSVERDVYSGVVNLLDVIYDYLEDKS